MKKTALQEAIEAIEKQIEPLSEQIMKRHDLYDDGMHTGLLLSISILKSKLPKERDQIETAFLWGYNKCLNDANDIQLQESFDFGDRKYYKQIYGDGK